MKRLTQTLVLVLGGLGCADHDAALSEAAAGRPEPEPGGGTANPAGPSASPGREWMGDEAAPVNDDRYTDVGTQPFVETGHDPFSTFGADVDTASFDIFSRDVGRYGVLPDPLSVRLEEYVNAFDYDYPAPAYGAEVPFDVTLAAADHPMGRDTALLRVGITAANPPGFVKRPTNLVFLVDTSGSMGSEDKLPVVQHLLRETLEELDASDTVSIVTYAGDVAVRLGPTSALDRTPIEAAIDSLLSGGGTAGASGINLAYEQAERGFVEGGFNHVVLCTDGEFNIGIASDDELVDLIEEKRETGITLTALGFGRGNLNDSMMERVSNAGNGIYSVITSREHARRYAAEDLLRTVTHVGKDIKIQVEFNPDHVVAYRLLGYENRAIADDDFRRDEVDAGEIGAGFQVTALYELVLQGQAIPVPEGAPPAESGVPVEGAREVRPEELLRVKLRWKELAAAPEDPATELVRTLVPSDVSANLVDEDMRWAVAIAALAELLKQSPFASMEDLEEIERLVRPQADYDRDRGELVRLFELARPMIEAR